MVALTLGNLPTTSARNFTTPDGEEDSGGAFIMIAITIICTVVIMQLASCIANSMCARPATPRLYKTRGTQTLVVIITQSIWAEPKKATDIISTRIVGRFYAPNEQGGILLVMNVAESQ